MLLHTNTKVSIVHFLSGPLFLNKICTTIPKKNFLSIRERKEWIYIYILGAYIVVNFFLTFIYTLTLNRISSSFKKKGNFLLYLFGK